MAESVEVDLRFNFDEIPIIIYVSKDKYAKYPFKYVSIDHIKNFIELKNKAMIDLPKELGFFDYFIKTFELIVNIIMLKCSSLKADCFLVLIVIYIAFLIIFSILTFTILLIIKYCFLKYTRNQKSKHSQIKKKNKIKFK